MKIRIIAWETSGNSVFDGEAREVEITKANGMWRWNHGKLCEAVTRTATECRERRDKWLAKQKLAEADRKKAGA